MNFYPFHIGDYASATRHLSWIEDAAYRRLLDVYYVKEEPLPMDVSQVYRLVVASTDEQREAVDVVLGEFFICMEDGYHHTRCDAEIQCANEKKNKASQSAQERWRIAREKEIAKQSNNECNTDAMRTHEYIDANASKTPCEGNAPNPNPKVNLKPTHAQARKAASPEGFAEFWLAYPKKVGKGAAEAAWRKLRPPLPSCLNAVSAAATSNDWTKEGGRYIPNPATWINQRRWEDEGLQLSVVEKVDAEIVSVNGASIPLEFLKRVGLRP